VEDSVLVGELDDGCLRDGVGAIEELGVSGLGG
jgi:hypothetical protein